jgi:hypothetical protein
VDDSYSPEIGQLSLTLAAWIMALVGWAGLFYLLFVADLTPAGNPSRPVPGAFPIWLFFVLLLLALTGTAVPFVRYLNRRFGSALVPPPVLLRQSLWIGFFGAASAWLLKSRILSLATVLLLGAGLGGIEWFLRMRERSRWAPDSDSDEPA